MEKFTVHTGRAVPLRRSNVDTDQIIPAVWLKRVSRTGFGTGLFAAWRATTRPSCSTARSTTGASILVAGPGLRHRLLPRARRLGAAGLRLPGRALAPVRRHLPRQLAQGRAAHDRRCPRTSSSSCGQRIEARPGAPSSPSTWPPGRCATTG